MSIVGYGIGVKLARGAGFRANLALGRAAVNLTKKGGLLSGLRKVATKHGAGKFAKRLHKASGHIQNLAAQVRKPGFETLDDAREHLTATRAFVKGAFKRTDGGTGKVFDYRLSSLLGETKVLKKSKVTKWFRDARKYDAKYLEGGQVGGLRLSVFGKLKKGLDPEQIKKASFGGKDAWKVTQARAGRWASDFLSAMPVMYAIDKARGVQSDRKWYDPKGMGAWALETGAMDLGFQALSPLASGLASAGGRIAMKAIGRKGAENITAGALRFGQAIDDGTHHVTSAFSKAMDAAAKSKDPGSIKKPIRTISGLMKASAVFGETFNRNITRTLTKKPGGPRKTMFDRALEELESAGRTVDRTLGSNIEGDLTRNQMKKEFGKKPTGFSNWMNKLLSMADEKTSMISYQKQAHGKYQGLYRGRGAVSFQGKDFTFSNIHPQAIAENFNKFMSKHGTGLMGIRQLAHANIKYKSAFVAPGESVNLGVNYSPEQVALPPREVGDAFDLSFYLKGSETNQKQKGEILANLQAGKYKIKENEAAVFANDSLFLVQHNARGESNIHRMGFTPDDNAFLRYSSVPISSAGNMATVMRKTSARVALTPHDGKEGSANPTIYRGGEMPSKMNEDSVGLFETGSKQRETIWRKITKLFTPGRHTDINNESVLFSNKGILNGKEFKSKLDAIPQDEGKKAIGLLKTISGKTKNFEAVINDQLFKSGKDIENIVREFDTGLSINKNGKDISLKLGDFLLDQKGGLDVDEVFAKTQLVGSGVNSPIQTSDFKTDDALSLIKKFKFINETNKDSFMDITKNVTGYGKMNNVDAYNNLILRKVLTSSNSTTDTFINYMLEQGAVSRHSKGHQNLKALSLLSKIDDVNPESMETGVSAIHALKDWTDQAQQSKDALIDFGKRVDPVYNLNTHNPNISLGRKLNTSNMFIVKAQAEKVDDMGNLTNEYINIDNPIKSLLGSRVKESGQVTDFDRIFDYSIEKDNQYFTMSKVLMQNTVDVINDTANVVGLGFEENSLHGMGDLMRKLAFKRVIPAMAIGAAWNAADAWFDESLDYHEFILVKNKQTDLIEFRKIGELVDNEEYKDYLAMSIFNGNKAWKDITNGIRHIRKSTLTNTKTRCGGEVLVTNCHSLFEGDETNLVETIPEIGKRIVAFEYSDLLNTSNDFIDLRAFADSNDNLVIFMKELNSRNIQRIRHSNIDILSSDEIWIRNNVMYRKSGLNQFRYEISCSAYDIPESLLPRCYVRYKRQKQYVPLLLEMNETIAWFLGMYIAEGSSWESMRGKENRSGCTSIACKREIHRYKGNLYDAIVSATLELFSIEPKQYNTEIRFGGDLAPLFFRYIKCGTGAINKTVPLPILNASYNIKISFIQGYFDGDGYWSDKLNEVRFTTISRHMIVSLVYLLKSMRINHIRIKHIDRQNDNWSKCYELCTRELELNNVELRMHSNRTNGRQPYSSFTQDVVSMESHIKQPEFVYDISVKDAEKFVGGIGLYYMHNSQLYEGTALGEGLNVFAGSQVARARLGAQNILDKTGVGGVARYMEDLLPGAVSSPLSGAVRGIGSPIAGLGVGYKMGGPTGSLIGGAIGAGVSLLTAGGPLGTFGAWDISKDRNELIEEYSGRKEVAVKRGRFWLFGSGPFGGRETEYYRPNWYASMRAQSEYTPTLYGSKLEKLLAPLDAHHYAEKHYNSRPYLDSGTMFENIPLFGKLVPFGAKKMHEEDYKYLGMNHPVTGNDFSGMGMQSDYQMDVIAGSEHSMNTVQNTFSQQAGGSNKVMRKSSPNAIAQSTMLTAEELTGLRGWGTSLAREAIMGSKSPWEDVAVMRTAQEMSNPARMYWDMELGDMMGANEIIRRFIKYDPAWMKKMGSGLPNTMPGWMPDSFQVGDPFTSLKQGEMRLPGQAYAAGHNVEFSMPFDANMFGMSFEEQIDNFTGERLPYTEAEKYKKTSTALQDVVAEQLSSSNSAVQRDVNYFNPTMNLSGNADIVKNIGGKNHMMNIKVVGNDTFADLSNQIDRDKSELNATLSIAKQASGTILYVNAESGQTKSVGVSADYGQFRKEFGRVNQARNQALNELSKGVSVNAELGNAFSRVDRLNILSDIAPNSKEFYNVKRQVQQMQQVGVLSPSEQQKADVALKQRDSVQRGFDFEKNRFYNIGTAVTDAERQRQSQINREYNFLERGIGAGWEYMTNELYSPIHTKFMGETTALERYKRTQVYGQETKLWDKPYEHFVRPYKDQLMSNDDFLQGAITGALPGVIFGPTAAVTGAAAGAMIGAFTGPGDIPDYRKREREIVAQTDAMEYAKYSNLYNATGSQDALKQMQKTMMFSNSDKNATLAQKISSVPTTQRPYLQAFAEAGTQEEREEILQYVPDYMKGMLVNEWNNQGGISGPANSGIPANQRKAISEMGKDPWVMSQNMQDVTVKKFEAEALDAHDVGLGFNKQAERIRQQEMKAANVGSTLGPDIRSALAAVTGSMSITIINNNASTTAVILEID